MVATLLLLGLALRSGLALRRSRLGRMRRDTRQRAQHLRWAKPAVILVGVGALGGALSSHFLRDWRPLSTLHGALGLAAAILIGLAAALGHRIEAGKARAFDAHALIGLLGVALAAVGAVAGFVLLP